jgi:hypothetical protein
VPLCSDCLASFEKNQEKKKLVCSFCVRADSNGGNNNNNDNGGEEAVLVGRRLDFSVTPVPIGRAIANAIVAQTADDVAGELRESQAEALASMTAELNDLRRDALALAQTELPRADASDIDWGTVGF